MCCDGEMDSSLVKFIRPLKNVFGAELYAEAAAFTVVAYYVDFGYRLFD